MTKVGEYLEKKPLLRLELPKMYVVESGRTGVELPVERQIIEIIERNMSRTYYSGNKPREVNILEYILDDKTYPYDIEIEEGKIFASENGFASGVGDLWVWTYYSTLSLEDAREYYEKELERVTEKYLK